MSYKVPMGPYHPGLEEPYKLDMICEGETVQDAELTIGFNFRGIEHLAETRNYFQVIALMERVCGICSGVHTLTFCMAAEALAQASIPTQWHLSLGTGHGIDAEGLRHGGLFLAKAFADRKR